MRQVRVNSTARSRLTLDCARLTKWFPSSGRRNQARQDTPLPNFKVSGDHDSLTQLDGLSPGSTDQSFATDTELEGDTSDTSVGKCKEKQASALVGEKTGTAGAVTQSRRKRTVLILEDEPVVRGLLVTLLELFGYRVLEAGTPEKALRIAKESDVTIDMIIADIFLPNSSGREVVEIIRSIYPRISALYVSGYPRETLAHLGVLPPKTGHFLRKPFGVDHLRNAVNRLSNEDAENAL